MKLWLKTRHKRAPPARYDQLRRDIVGNRAPFESFKFQPFLSLGVFELILAGEFFNRICPKPPVERPDSGRSNAREQTFESDSR